MHLSVHFLSYISIWHVSNMSIYIIQLNLLFLQFLNSVSMVTAIRNLIRKNISCSLIAYMYMCAELECGQHNLCVSKVTVIGLVLVNCNVHGRLPRYVYTIVYKALSPKHKDNEASIMLFRMHLFLHVLPLVEDSINLVSFLLCIEYDNNNP